MHKPLNQEQAKEWQQGDPVPVVAAPAKVAARVTQRQKLADLTGQKQKKHTSLPKVGLKRSKMKRSGKATQQQKQLRKLYADYKVVTVKVDPKGM